MRSTLCKFNYARNRSGRRSNSASCKDGEDCVYLSEQEQSAAQRDPVPYLHGRWQRRVSARWTRLLRSARAALRGRSEAGVRWDHLDMHRVVRKVREDGRGGQRLGGDRQPSAGVEGGDVVARARTRRARVSSAIPCVCREGILCSHGRPRKSSNTNYTILEMCHDTFVSRFCRSWRGASGLTWSCFSQCAC